MADLTTVRNIGPAMAGALTKSGIATAERLRDLGADGAYAKLLANGMRPHFIAYYSMAMGLQGRPWNDAHGPEKTALRSRFDQLVADTQRLPHAGDGLSDELARELDALGVLPRGTSL